MIPAISSKQDIHDWNYHYGEEIVLICSPKISLDTIRNRGEADEADEAGCHN
jgi:hypothetical protein